MRYYVVSDVHGFYSILMRELQDAGYFKDSAPHKLILLGDMFDRGKEAVKMQDFILDAMSRDEVILIRGNHEDLFERLVTADGGRPYAEHRSNGTYGTALQLTGFDEKRARMNAREFAAAARRTPYYREIIPATRDYFETQRYIFVHGWIPCFTRLSQARDFLADWRDADSDRWEMARWTNGMDVAKYSQEEKTIVCGHVHASYGHRRFEGRGTEFGEDADFSPYIARGIMAIDACAVCSGRLNVCLIEDDEML